MFIMLGALIGDAAGLPYERLQFDNTGEFKLPEGKPLITKDSPISDDTILTMAILDAGLHGGDYKEKLKDYVCRYIEKYKNGELKPMYFPHFINPFSQSIVEWGEKEDDPHEKRTSKGNGAMMRISAIGWLFDTEEKVIEQARLATIPTHDSEEAIDCATKVALIIFYLRRGMDIEAIYKKLGIECEYKTFTEFNYRCGQTIGNCLHVASVATSFEDGIRKAIEMGGDTDTNAAIVGSILEARFGIPIYLQETALALIPEEFEELVYEASGRVLKLAS